MGKWEIDGGRYIYHDARDGRRTYICKMDNVSAPEKEMQANARLIAAAPETKQQRDALLAACKEAFGIFNILAEGKGEIAKGLSFEGLRERLEQAIAAAQIEPE